MKLIPPLRTVSLSEAEPGELVRIQQNDTASLGIISISPAHGRCFVSLDARPGYSLISPRGNPTALSYGKDYAFHASPTARMRAAATGKDIGANGALIVCPDHASIQLRSKQPGLLSAFHDIASATLLDNEHPLSERAALLDWEVRLNLQPLDAPPLFKFSVQNPSD